MSEVRNVTFNPNTTFNTLDNLCRKNGDEGFALVRIVPVDQYQSVAVFERPSEVKEDQS